MSRIPYTNKVGETLGSIADPAAAYSLRALGGGDPMVVRVRRSSDDAEKDFTASDMDSGSVADWVNGKQDTTLPCDVASAAAAYSLRSVNSNYTGSVVRVRRSSDNAEKDFSDVSLIADWVNEDVVTYQSDFSSGTDGWSSSGGNATLAGNVDTIGGLDNNLKVVLLENNSRHFFFKINPTVNKPLKISGKFYIPSTNSHLDGFSIKNTATGTLFKSFSSPNTDTWIDFSLEYTPTASNLTFVPTNLGSEIFNDIGADDVIYLHSNLTITQLTADGHVTTWYDQSGNDNHATQVTAASQPKIVDSGAYLGEIDFPSSSATLGFSNISCGTTYSFFCALPRLDVSNFKIISDGGNAPRIDFEKSSPDQVEVVDNNFGNKKFNTSDTFANSDNLTSIINASTTVNLFYNGNASSTNPFTLPNNNIFNTLGGLAEGGAYEVIIYDSDQSSNREAIETNINNHYDIY